MWVVWEGPPTPPEEMTFEVRPEKYEEVSTQTRGRRGHHSTKRKQQKRSTWGVLQLWEGSMCPEEEQMVGPELSQGPGHRSQVHSKWVESHCRVLKQASDLTLLCLSCTTLVPARGARLGTGVQTGRGDRRPGKENKDSPASGGAGRDTHSRARVRRRKGPTGGFHMWQGTKGRIKDTPGLPAGGTDCSIWTRQHWSLFSQVSSQALFTNNELQRHQTPLNRGQRTPYPLQNRRADLVIPTLLLLNERFCKLGLRDSLQASPSTYLGYLPPPMPSPSLRKGFLLLALQSPPQEAAVHRAFQLPFTRLF